MSKKNKLEQSLSAKTGHKLHTRRDLIAHGMLGASSAILLPSLSSLLLERIAFGDPMCSTGEKSAQGMMPFLCVDLAGGANLAGSNVMVGKGGGQLDFIADYATLGLPTGMHPRNAGQLGFLTGTKGLAFHADSAFLRGLKSTATAATLANMDGVVFASSSDNDTGNNPHNPMYWINKAGRKGELVNLVGVRANDSGGNSRAPATSINPAAKPATISKPSDALGLVSLGKLATMLSPKRAEDIMKAVSKMSQSQLALFSEQDLPSQVKTLVECGYIQSSDLINRFDATALDPARDADISAIFTGAFALSNADAGKMATVSKLLVDGNSGAGTITLGGYDYHDGTRATGELKDQQAGALIGLAFELAARKKQDMAIYVFSDGAVTSSGRVDSSANGRGKGVWQGDSAERAAALMLVYRQDGKPAMRDSKRQIGAYKDGGSIDGTFNLISNSVDNLSKAVVANYLAMYGKEGDLQKIVGDNPFGGNLAQYLAFAKFR